MRVSTPRRGWPRLIEQEAPTPGLDPAHDGVRIAHVTDLHVGMLTPHERIRGALELAQSHQPDLLFLTGDFVCYSPRFVGALADILADIRMTAYAVLGNHNHWTDRQGVQRALERAGVSVLNNAHTTIHLRHSPFDVIGVDDAVTKHADVKRAFTGLRHRHGDPRSRLVMTHVPAVANRIADYGEGLALAGHTHGGHIHIPKVTAHLFRRIGSPYLKGFYDVDKLRLYVNCGVGASSVPIRAGAPSEVALLTLRAA